MTNSDNVARISEIPRGPGGLFAKGGPGRPKGAKGKKSRDALERIKSFGPEAIQALHAAVIAREKWAVEYVLSKILPTQSRMIEFEDITAEDAAEALKRGDISIVEFREIMNGLSKYAELTEVAIIREKLEALEKAVSDGAA